MDGARPLRDRAHVVCTECHSRKVKCDLQDRPDQICKNCRRLGHHCIRRDGVRKKRVTPRAKSIRHHVGSTAGPSVESMTPVLSPQSVGTTPTTSAESRLPKSFISPSTVMHYDDGSDQQGANSTPCPPLDLRTSILKLTQADVLPKPPLRQALIDAYFEHVHILYPVVERDDLANAGSNILLQQAVCLAGSLVQHDSESVQLCRSQYQKVKTLIYINYENDNIILLKTLCLLTCYSVLPTDRVTLDGPWHWLGVSIRLAIQIGLHKDSTYRQYSNPGCIRRIFWHLVNSDRLVTSCWGRPSGFPCLRDWDIPCLLDQDFTNPDRSSKVFLQALSLSEITGRIAEMTSNPSCRSSDGTTNLVERLCGWIRDLPQELRLYGLNKTRQPFWRPSVELHIWYFVNLILLQLLDRTEYPWRISPSSLAAAFCIARLYEEIYYREETARLLNIHGYFCMVAAVPLICYSNNRSGSDPVRDESIDVLCRVLVQMSGKYGGSEVVLRKVRQLRQEMSYNHHGIRAGMHQSRATDQPMRVALSIQARRDELFPFSGEFSEALELLKCDVASFSYEAEGASEDELESAPNPQFFDNFMNLADIWAMNYPMVDLENENEISGIGL